MTIKSRSSGRACARLLHFSMFAVSQKIGMGEEQAAAMSNKQRLIASLAEGRRAPTRVNLYGAHVSRVRGGAERA
jgi:hypothetical protein